MTTGLEGDEGSASHLGRSLPPENTRYPLYRRLGGPQGPSGQARKISPLGIRFPDRPARSQSLYRLLYSAHRLINDKMKKIRKETVVAWFMNCFGICVEEMRKNHWNLPKTNTKLYCHTTLLHDTEQKHVTVNKITIQFSAVVLSEASAGALVNNSKTFRIPTIYIYRTAT